MNQKEIAMEHAMSLEGFHSKIERTVLGPEETRKWVSNPPHPVWIYRYSYRAPGASRDWVLCIATLGEPKSGKLSLGGFRIVPEAREREANFAPERESMELGLGMEEKVLWSRLLGVGGPKGRTQLERIVGGKCVMLPTSDARVGKPRDRELLQFACACLNDMEAFSGVYLTTGQDLGHGVMSDGKTASLDFLHDNFKGSIISDTSKPTAEGNFYVLRGMLKGLGRGISGAKVGFVGCGNVGRHILKRARAEGAEVSVIEASELVLRSLKADGVATWTSDKKAEFLSLPLDALVINANGGSLDPTSIDKIISNSSIKIICGSENLSMPDPNGAEQLRKARRVCCPHELGGMMGYLTAVEEYLCQSEGAPYDINVMFEASKALEASAEKITKQIHDSDYAYTFENMVHKLYGNN